MTLETALMIYLTISLAVAFLGFYFIEFKPKIIPYQLLAIFTMALSWPLIVFYMIVAMLFARKEYEQ